MQKLQTYWFKPLHQAEGKPEVEFQLRPVDQRTHYAMSLDLKPNGIGADGAIAAFEYSVVGWRGMPVEFSHQAKHALLNGAVNPDVTIWLYNIAGECYRRAQLGDDELKNS
jgi:hypothetical protein